MKSLAIFYFLLCISISFSQWVKDDSIPSNPFITNVSVSDSGSAWAIGGSSNGNVIARRVSFGYWDTVSTYGINSSYLMTGIASIDNMNAWVTGYGSTNSGAQIFRTSNGGLNWSVQVNTGGNFGYFNDIRFSKINPAYGYAWSDPPQGPGSALKIYKTSNYGANWTEYSVMIDSHYVGVLGSTCITDSNHAWFGLMPRNGGTGLGKIVYTSNGGETFSVLSFNYSITAVLLIEFKADNLTGIVTTPSYGSNYFRTTNGGNNWQLINMSSTFYLTRFFNINNSNTWYACKSNIVNEAIFKSTDNGLSWITMTIPETIPRAIANMDLVWKDNKVYAYSIANGGYVYKLADSVQLIGVNDPSSNIPTVFSLSQNYPNPFNPVTQINYTVPKTSMVKMVIYDVIGREVITLVNDVKVPGNYSVSFDGSNLASGVYFYKMISGDFTDVKKMVVLK
jgi:photosystem II stability/assembly factor-like uncharacterized protein